MIEEGGERERERRERERERERRERGESLNGKCCKHRYSAYQDACGDANWTIEAI